MTTTTVEHDGLTLDVHLHGPDDGTPVLLLHGFPQSSLSWRGVVEELAEDPLRLAVPDQRGYSPGARPVGVEAYGIGTLSADALAVADALGWDSFHVVGHDWGASLGWHLAAHHADRVRTLTALSIPHLAAFGWAIAHDPEQQRLSSYLSVFRTPGRAEEALMADDAATLRAMYDGVVPAEDQDHYVRMMAEGALTPALSWYRGMGRELASTPPVSVPSTFVWGTDDRATSRAAAERCADLVQADYRFVELDGVSHWSPDEVPGVVADEVRARVAGTATPTGGHAHAETDDA